MTDKALTAVAASDDNCCAFPGEYYIECTHECHDTPSLRGSDYALRAFVEAFRDDLKVEGQYVEADGTVHSLTLWPAVDEEGATSFTLTEDIKPPTAEQYGIILECPKCEKPMDFHDDAVWRCGCCGESVALADLDRSHDGQEGGC